MKIKVLGIGSPFGDDRAGWRAAEILKQKISHLDIHRRVEIECCDRPGTLLIDLMRDSNQVFLIDAVKTGSAVGTVHRFKNNEIHEMKNLLSTHDAGLAQALQIAEALNALPEELILYGIEIDAADLNSPISKPVEEGIQQAVIQLEAEIAHI